MKFMDRLKLAINAFKGNTLPMKATEKEYMETVVDIQDQLTRLKEAYLRDVQRHAFKLDGKDYAQENRELREDLARMQRRILNLKKQLREKE